MAKTPIENRTETSVQLTHPERIYWPADGVSKQDLVDYYAIAWPRLSSSTGPWHCCVALMA